MDSASPGILLLSHCGFSFMEDLIDLAKNLGRECYVLSSKPSPEHSKRIELLSARVDWIQVTEKHSLTREDLQSAFQNLQRQHKNIEACLSVWEGYRHLMAWMNHRVGIADLSEETILKITDKYRLRLDLKQRGLSQIKAEMLTPVLLAAQATKPEKKFIKPRKGLASYGAFSLTPSTRWADIEKIQQEALQDTEYSNLISDFILEDYIEGTEYSFEVIGFEQAIHVMAIHEKIDVFEKERTVHEGACVSPPISLTSEEIEGSVQWIQHLFKQLNVSWGCFHVEAKYHQGCWEVIEINPRVGGALISASVAVLTGGESMLSFWLKSLLFQHESQEKKQFIQQLNEQGIGNNDFSLGAERTFFRVYFAEPGKTIRTIQINTFEPQPLHQRVFLTEGQQTLEASRELFLAQALWKISLEQHAILSHLIHDSQHFIEAHYE